LSGVSSLRVTVIGAGNGGQAMTAHLSQMGCSVSLYNKGYERIRLLNQASGIRMTGSMHGVGHPQLITQDLAEAVRDTQLIMVVTTADAHRQIAEQLIPLLTDGQIIVLNPGRTGGALEFRHVLDERGRRRIYVAEAQSLVYACRIIRAGVVRIIGVKTHVPLCALPNCDTPYVSGSLRKLYSCFVPAANVLVTSLENIGAVFHPAIVLFNAATIERGQRFHFYHDMTSRISDFLEKLDRERLEIGRAYRLNLVSASDWIVKAYPGTPGQSLCDRMRANPAYSGILAPETLFTRYLFEDLATGLVPFVELAEVAGVRTPLMRSLVDIGGALLGTDFWKQGRTLEAMGLAGMNRSQILEFVNQ